MKLGYFSMPIHPLGKDWRQCLREDREAFILADKLGFAEAFVGEHVTDVEENITSSLMFIASLVGDTRQIRLGTGTVNLPNRHPAAVACEVSMLDHMLDGRFILGVGPGGLMSDAEIFGSFDQDRAAMFQESLSQIIQLWTTEPPYDIEGKFWKLSTARTNIPEFAIGALPKPLQRPHPPIVLTVASPFSSSALQAGQHGWGAISANFLLPKWAKSHWVKYLEGAAKTGIAADSDNWRIAKTVFVADTMETARRYATDPDGPYYYYYNSIHQKLGRRPGGLNVFKEDPSQPDSEITPAYLCDKLTIYGTADAVADGILSMREDVGDFGTLLYAGIDWQDPDLARKSMVLLAEKVLPSIDGAHRAATPTPAVARAK